MFVFFPNSIQIIILVPVEDDDQERYQQGHLVQLLNPKKVSKTQNSNIISTRVIATAVVLPNSTIFATKPSDWTRA